MNYSEIAKVGRALRPDAGMPTYMDLVCALCDVMDGVRNHEIRADTGLPPEDCERIASTRDAVHDLWLHSLADKT